MGTVVIRASRRTIRNRNGSETDRLIEMGVMRTGLVDHGMLLEKPTFRILHDNTGWHMAEVHHFARLYTKGIHPWL
jgi:hypothetical protein